MVPLQYPTPPYSLEITEPSLTETEHTDSCDINLMIKNAISGRQIRGGPELQYGYDDTTLDAVQFRIQKAKIEQELQETAQQNEFEEEELKHIPQDIQKKFGFKAKKKQSQKNDDQTTKKTDFESSPIPNVPTPAGAGVPTSQDAISTASKTKA